MASRGLQPHGPPKNCWICSRSAVFASRGRRRNICCILVAETRCASIEKQKHRCALLLGPTRRRLAASPRCWAIPRPRAACCPLNLSSSVPELAGSTPPPKPRDIECDLDNPHRKHAANQRHCVLVSENQADEHDDQYESWDGRCEPDRAWRSDGRHEEPSQSVPHYPTLFQRRLEAHWIEKLQLLRLAVVLDEPPAAGTTKVDAPPGVGIAFARRPRLVEGAVDPGVGASPRERLAVELREPRPARHRAPVHHVSRIRRKVRPCRPSIFPVDGSEPREHSASWCSGRRWASRVTARRH